MTTKKATETTKTTETEETTKKEFKSMCGFEFDPSKSGDCHELCKSDNPDEFQRCLTNYEEKPTKPKKQTVSRDIKGKTLWGHLNGCQGGLIDICLSTAKNPLTLDEISEYCVGRPARVLHHIKHLEKNVEIDIRVNETLGIYWFENKNITGNNDDPSISGFSIKKLSVKK